MEIERKQKLLPWEHLGTECHRYFEGVLGFVFHDLIIVIFPVKIVLEENIKNGSAFTIRVILP
jgi:hypothetical protein